MKDLAEGVHQQSENDSVRFEACIARALETFAGSSTAKDVREFVEHIRHASAHPQFPRGFFDDHEIAKEYQDQIFHLDQPFLHGVYEGFHEKSPTDNQEFFKLLSQLDGAISAHTGEGINVEKAQVETQIVGYLVAKKVSNKDARFIPEELDVSLPRLIDGLDFLARNAYAAFDGEFSSEPQAPAFIHTPTRSN